MSTSSKSDMLIPTLADIESGNVDNATAAHELNRRRQRFQELPYLPPFIRESGNEIFKDALYNWCPAQFEALRAGTAQVDRPIVLILQCVIKEIDELMREWEGEKAEWISMVRERPDVLIENEVDEESGAHVRTYAWTAAQER